MIKKLVVAEMGIRGGIVSAMVKVVHDDKNSSGIQVSLELDGDPKLLAATEAMLHQIKESMKVKLGIAPTFAE